MRRLRPDRVYCAVRCQQVLAPASGKPPPRRPGARQSEHSALGEEHYMADEQLAEIGLTGLAVMGQNLARNIARNGFPIVVHNRTAKTTDAFLEGLEGDDPLTGAS